jgi:hypothetical protein
MSSSTSFTTLSSLTASLRSGCEAPVSSAAISSSRSISRRIRSKDSASLPLSRSIWTVIFIEERGLRISWATPAGHLAHHAQALGAADLREHAVHRLDQVVELGAAADARHCPPGERCRLGGQPLERRASGAPSPGRDQDQRQARRDARQRQDRAALLGRTTSAL